MGNIISITGNDINESFGSSDGEDNIFLDGGEESTSDDEECSGESEEDDEEEDIVPPGPLKQPTIPPSHLKIQEQTTQLPPSHMMMLKESLKDLAKNEVKDNEAFCLPEEGIPPEEVLHRVRKYFTDFRSKFLDDGRCSGSVYQTNNTEHNKAFDEAFCIFSSTNPLHYDLYPALCKFEREIIRFTRELMHGDSNSRGVVTSGGTESLMLSIKAYREYYSKKKPEIKEPEILTLESIHSSVDKGCNLMNIKLTKIKISRQTFTVSSSDEVEKYVTKNTIAIYISAPCYPFGVIDDVEGIAKIAKKYDIGLHVDSCLGGYFLPFAYRHGDLGIPKFDFLVDGVTSISADTHKYGMAPKGTSVLLFRTKELRNACYFVHLNWQGGLYITPTFGGSRSGGVIASCWTALMINGMDTYMRQARMIHETCQTIQKGVRKIEGVKVAGGSTKAMVVNIMVSEEYEKKFSIYQVMDEMKKYGWKCVGTINPQGMHFCVTSKSVGNGELFVKDLQKAVESVMLNPQVHLRQSASVYGLASHAPQEILREVGEMVLSHYLDGGEKETTTTEENGMKRS